VQQSSETGGSLLREDWGFLWTLNSGLGYWLGGFFPLAMDSRVWALFDELVYLPLIGGNNLESILFISPVTDL
jgi:hypothetical protein